MIHFPCMCSRDTALELFFAKSRVGYDGNCECVGAPERAMCRLKVIRWFLVTHKAQRKESEKVH